MTKAVRFFETSGATQPLRSLPRSCSPKLHPLRTSTVHYFWVLILLFLNQPPSWKPTPCRLSGTVYATYSQLPFIPVYRLLGTRHAAMKVTQYDLVVIDVAASKYPLLLLRVVVSLSITLSCIYWMCGPHNAWTITGSIKNGVGKKSRIYKMWLLCHQLQPGLLCSFLSVTRWIIHKKWHNFIKTPQNVINRRNNADTASFLCQGSASCC